MIQKPALTIPLETHAISSQISKIGWKHFGSLNREREKEREREGERRRPKKSMDLFIGWQKMYLFGMSFFNTLYF